jgi:hypothetical protein
MDFISLIPTEVAFVGPNFFGSAHCTVQLDEGYIFINADTVTAL